MVIVLTLIHLVVCFFLMIVVLLQSGKAADLAGAFGGMGSQTAFGARGSATVLSKATTIAAALFMITSMSLAILATRNRGTDSSSVLETEGSQTQTQTAPASSPATTQQGTEPAQGQPAVTFTQPGTGESKTVPLNIPPREGEQKPSSTQTPENPAPEN